MFTKKELTAIEKKLCWQNVSVYDYYDIVDILSDDTFTGLDKNILIITKIANLEDGDQLRALDPNTARELFDKLQFLNSLDIKAGRYKLPRTLQLGDDWSCVIDTDITNLTVAQYFDFQSLIQLGFSRENLPRLLSIFIVPKGKQYNVGYDLKDLQEAIGANLSFLLAQQIINFLVVKYIAYINRLEVYLAKMTKKLQAKKILSEKDSDLLTQVAKASDQLNQLKEMIAIVILYIRNCC